MFDSILGFAKQLAPILSVGKLGFDVYSSFAAHSAQKKAAEQQRANIEEARANNQAALAERNEQQQAQIKNTMSERARQAMLERARINAIAAESGGGVSDMRLAMMPDAALGMDIGMLESNSASLNRQFAREAARIENTAQSQRNSVKSPTGFNLAADLFGAGLGFVDRSRTMNPKAQISSPLTIR